MKTRIVDPRKGVAIVLVLSFLVLISVLVVAFFSSVKSELSGAKSYADGANSKQLADSAVQMVMGIIQQATSGGSSVAWASQSGMIRTYGDSASTPLACYKLYSSDKMVLAGSHLPFDPATDWDPGWGAKPAQFTDLNRPVVDSAGNAVFPILDGNGMNPLTQSASGASTSPYIGYDADADGRPDIDGFAIDPAKVNYDGSINAHRIPMPVKWIYVLRDGTLSAPDPVSATTATFLTQPNSASIPSDTNPIVGRIAFWTDDETCKVNINTASEGSYYDYPRAMSNLGAPNSSNQEEVLLGLNQPVAKEYQRFPGHPATTSLSAVIKPPTGWTPPGSLPANWTSPNWKAAQWGLQLQKLVPRLLAGGSQGGSVNTLTTAGAANSMISEPVPDRLYSSPDELVFQPIVSTSGVRAENDTLIAGGGGAILNKSTLAKSPFFPYRNEPCAGREPFQSAQGFYLAHYYWVRERGRLSHHLRQDHSILLHHRHRCQCTRFLFCQARRHASHDGSSHQRGGHRPGPKSHPFGVSAHFIGKKDTGCRRELFREVSCA